MCWELCGLDMDASAEEMEAYDAWLLASEEEEEAPNTIGEREALERFDDFLDEVYPTVSVCGYDFDAARALKEMDPTAYQEEFNNWLDSEGLELE